LTEICSYSKINKIFFKKFWMFQGWK